MGLTSAWNWWREKWWCPKGRLRLSRSQYLSREVDWSTLHAPGTPFTTQILINAKCLLFVLTFANKLLSVHRINSSRMGNPFHIGWDSKSSPLKEVRRMVKRKEKRRRSRVEERNLLKKKKTWFVIRVTNVPTVFHWITTQSELLFSPTDTTPDRARWGGDTGTYSRNQRKFSDLAPFSCLLAGHGGVSYLVHVPINRDIFSRVNVFTLTCIPQEVFSYPGTV